MGTAYNLTPGGAFTTLYNFCAQRGCADGGKPVGLIQATDGNIYGMTGEGGSLGPYAHLYSPIAAQFSAFPLVPAPFVETRLTSGRVGVGVEILGNKSSRCQFRELRWHSRGFQSVFSLFDRG